MSQKRLLVVSQVYPPDPASVGQHIADVAEEMTHRDWEVTVFTSNRGYDNYAELYKSSEFLKGVRVSRLSFTSFGKSSIFTRVIGQLSLLVQTLFRCLTIKRPDAVLVSTHLVCIVAPFLKFLRKIPYIYWIMDLNPDQAIAAGVLRKDSVSAKLYNGLQYLVLSRADTVVSLDKFMFKKVSRKAGEIPNHFILPPWPHEDLLIATPNENFGILTFLGD